MALAVSSGRIKAGLVYDESKLRQTRDAVCWLSANTWWQGSIYGTVQFTFVWDDLIKGKNVYWVEAIESYSPPAYRFLITERHLSTADPVVSYDPLVQIGPLRRRGSEWYWNAQHTSEFMFDTDISLEDCKEVRFVSHHSDICRLKGRTCSDRGRLWTDIGAEVLSFILGQSIHTANHAFVNAVTAENSYDLGLLKRRLAPNGSLLNGPVRDKDAWEALLKGALSLYGCGDHGAALKTVQSHFAQQRY